MDAVVTVKRALLSVSDKNGIAEFGRQLVSRGVEILSTGGTAKALEKAGVAVTPVEHYTGSPEIMDGRVKTLHPKVHGALLAVRDNPEHVRQMKEQGICAIDLVVVNLYPFRQTVAKPDVTLEDAVENIDIGGPAMLRSSAKNHRYVAVVVDPADYAGVLAEMDSKGGTTQQLRNRLCLKAFKHTAEYDTAIVGFLSGRYGAVS